MEIEKPVQRVHLAEGATAVDQLDRHPTTRARLHPVPCLVVEAVIVVILILRPLSSHRFFK